MISRRSILSMIGLGGAAAALPVLPAAEPTTGLLMADVHRMINELHTKAIKPNADGMYEFVGYPSEDSAGLWRLTDQQVMRWPGGGEGTMKPDVV